MKNNKELTENLKVSAAATILSLGYMAFVTVFAITATYVINRWGDNKCVIGGLLVFMFVSVFTYFSRICRDRMGDGGSNPEDKPEPNKKVEE